MTFYRYAIIFLAPVVFVAWWWFVMVSIDPEEEKVYRVLITKKPSTQYFLSTNESREVLSSWILLYNYPRGDFFLFEIDDSTSALINEGFYNSIHQNHAFLKKKIKEYYGISDFDFELSFTEKQQLDFLNLQGGSAFFNLYSTNLPLGEVYINEINYKHFLEGIENPYLRKISALGFWFNLLMSFQDAIPHAVYIEDYIESFYQVFSGNMNYPTFWALVKPLLYDDNNLPIPLNDQITFELDKNNIESIERGDRQIFIPYQRGAYDRNKIFNKLRQLEIGDQQTANQSITAQIKNTTKVTRLAARAAGFLRLRGIDIVEYLGFGAVLKRSVILDYSNQPSKRDYVKKITRIDKVYHLFSYRENYDFGIYLGEDLYVLQKPTSSNSVQD